MLCAPTSNTTVRLRVSNDLSHYVHGYFRGFLQHVQDSVTKANSFSPTIYMDFPKLISWFLHDSIELPSFSRFLGNCPNYLGNAHICPESRSCSLVWFYAFSVFWIIEHCWLEMIKQRIRDLLYSCYTMFLHDHHYVFSRHKGHVWYIMWGLILKLSTIQ